MKEAVCCCGHPFSEHNDNGPFFRWCQHVECRCKSFTDKRRSKRRADSKATREAGPKAEIIKLLESKGIRFFRMQSGSILVKRGRKIALNPIGTPDILCLLNTVMESGNILWLEIKRTEGGKPSKEQVAFQKQVESLGEIYLLARSAEYVKAWLDANI
jgi:hypothetical protein